MTPDFITKDANKPEMPPVHYYVFTCLLISILSIYYGSNNLSVQLSTYICLSEPIYIYLRLTAYVCMNPTAYLLNFFFFFYPHLLCVHVHLSTFIYTPSPRQRGTSREGVKKCLSIVGRISTSYQRILKTLHRPLARNDKRTIRNITCLRHKARPYSAHREEHRREIL